MNSYECVRRETASSDEIIKFSAVGYQLWSNCNLCICNMFLLCCTLCTIHNKTNKISTT